MTLSQKGDLYHLIFSDTHTCAHCALYSHAYFMGLILFNIVHRKHKTESPLYTIDTCAHIAKDIKVTRVSAVEFF